MQVVCRCIKDAYFYLHIKTSLHNFLYKKLWVDNDLCYDGKHLSRKNLMKNNWTFLRMWIIRGVLFVVTSRTVIYGNKSIFEYRVLYFLIISFDRSYAVLCLNMPLQLCFKVRYQVIYWCYSSSFIVLDVNLSKKFLVYLFIEFTVQFSVKFLLESIQIW